MYQKEAIEILEKTGALIRGDHFVYTSDDRHGEDYINKDAIYPHTKYVAWMCDRLAWHFYDNKIWPDVVVGPAIGGIIMSQWLANTMTKIIHGGVLSVYAEKQGKDFVFIRGYDKLVKGKDILVVEDTVNSGKSVRKIIDLVLETGGNVVGVGALYNRGGITAEKLEVPEFFALANVDLSSYSREECPFCKPGELYRPINQVFGKGKEFLASLKH